MKNWKAFEKHHVGGVVNKDINLFLELYSDSLNGVLQRNNQILGKAELKEAAKNYMDNFENLKFTPGGAVIGGDGAYWAGSIFLIQVIQILLLMQSEFMSLVRNR